MVARHEVIGAIYSRHDLRLRFQCKVSCKALTTLQPSTYQVRYEAIMFRFLTQATQKCNKHQTSPPISRCHGNHSYHVPLRGRGKGRR